tara:strand:+ start:277 stop:1209 length:933 start_codon:yes stop_codon:yes gene_type:complete
VRILFDNVNLQSSSGPNHFGGKLKKYLNASGNECGTDIENPDVQLSFIETSKQTVSTPLVLRIDGIYFDIDTDFVQMNKNILRTYEMADGVIFQSEYCKELIFKYFGVHNNWKVVHNGADLEQIEKIEPMKNEITARYENIWTCASSWYYNNNPVTPRRWKRLKENVEFFLTYAKSTDCLVVAGDVYQQDMIQHERIFYIGRLDPKRLLSLYKSSKYFIHLASPDACPNVIVDALACGCKIACSSLGGAREIAGPNALVVEEDVWDYNPMQLNGERKIDLTKITSNCYNVPIDMQIVATTYQNFMENLRE